MPVETRILLDIALIVFIILGIAYILFGPNVPNKY